MKISIHSYTGRQNGFAVITMVVMMNILVIFVAVNASTLHGLDVELNMLDKKQTQHWQHIQPKSAVTIAQQDKRHE